MIPAFDNLDAYFVDFGEPTTITVDYNDDVVEITGIFNAPVKEVNHLDELNRDPLSTVLVKTADVATLTKDNGITIDGVAYTILDIEPDGTGITLITLEKVHAG